MGFGPVLHLPRGRPHDSEIRCKPRPDFGVIRVANRRTVTPLPPMPGEGTAGSRRTPLAGRRWNNAWLLSLNRALN